MFISVLDLFKIGIGPSSSHTLGPMIAAYDFIDRIKNRKVIEPGKKEVFIRCTLKGSLAFTGKGHSTDHAVALGLHGHLPASLSEKDVSGLVKQIWGSDAIEIEENVGSSFNPKEHIVLDNGQSFEAQPNAKIFDLRGLENTKEHL